jgi:hypothetical protein
VIYDDDDADGNGNDDDNLGFDNGESTNPLIPPTLPLPVLLSKLYVYNNASNPFGSKLNILFISVLQLW